jgi:rhamnosyltransferase subunit B
MGLALGLAHRGHDVRLATSGFYREKIEAAGLRFSELRPLASPDDPHMLRQVLDPRRGPEYLIRELLLPHLSDMYDDLQSATEGADLLISGEVVVAAPLVAEKRRLPWAAAILAPFSFFSVHDAPALPFFPWMDLLTRAPPFIQRQLMRGAAFATRDWGRPIAELRRSLGLRPTRHPLLHDRFSPLLNLALFSSVLGERQPDWPVNTVQTGFVFYDQDERSTHRLSEFLAEGSAPITFTLGSAAVMDPGRFFEESAAAARILGRRAVMLVGNSIPDHQVEDGILTAQYAPYSHIFPHSACVVHQGGVGTTAQALRAGRPELVMPYAFDQPDNASRIARRGVGLTVARSRYSADRAATLVGRLLTEPRFEVKAAELARHIAGENGLERACDAVERLLASLGPTPPA